MREQKKGFNAIVSALLSAGADRQPIALIGHDGLELGGNGREPVSLPPLYKLLKCFTYSAILNK